MARKQNQANLDATTTKSSDDQSPDAEILWDFAFDQMMGLTHYLLQSKVLPLDHVLHVVRSFAQVTQVAGLRQASLPLDFKSLLVACATDVVIDYCKPDGYEA